MNNTGDPTLDNLLTWLTNGGSLTSPGAVIGLAFVVNTILIPLLERAAVHFGWNLAGPVKTQAVYAIGVVLVAVVGLATKTATTFAETFLLGAAVANVAMGIHATRTVAVKAAQATADMAQLQAAMPVPRIQADVLQPASMYRPE